MDKKVTEPFRVEALCKKTGYGKSYLSRVFREQTGETLAAYAVKLKIKRAKTLIREHDLNFTQISDRLSFDNPQYFSRVFKRVTGMTPTEFKASLQLSKE
jgi:AraC-like DNA-binding protein